MSPKNSLIALTGGSGFIGKHLIQRLLANNYHVRALVRKPNKLLINHPHLEIISGSLHSLSSLNTLVDNTDQVIHCAGRVRGATATEFDKDNVDGSRNLVHACQSSSTIKKIIFISSLAAREPDISYYSRSKNSAELLIKNISFADWSIIRPPAIYGPGDKELLALFDWMQKGILWIPGNPKQQFSLLHVHDLVNLIVTQLNSSVSKVLLEPSDGYIYTWEQIRQICSLFFKRKIWKITLPKTALASAANLNMVSSRLFNYSPMLTPSKIRELTHDNWLAHNQQPISEWSAQIDLKKGLSTLYSAE